MTKGHFSTLHLVATAIAFACIVATLFFNASFLALSCLIVDHLLWPDSVGLDVESALKNKSRLIVISFSKTGVFLLFIVFN